MFASPQGARGKRRQACLSGTNDWELDEKLETPIIPPPGNLKYVTDSHFSAES